MSDEITPDGPSRQLLYNRRTVLPAKRREPLVEKRRIHCFLEICPHSVLKFGISQLLLLQFSMYQSKKKEIAGVHLPTTISHFCIFFLNAMHTQALVC